MLVVSRSQPEIDSLNEKINNITQQTLPSFFKCEASNQEYSANESNPFESYGLNIGSGNDLWLLHIVGELEMNIASSVLLESQEDNLILNVNQVHSLYSSFGPCFDLFNCYLSAKNKDIISLTFPSLQYYLQNWNQEVSNEPSLNGGFWITKKISNSTSASSSVINSNNIESNQMEVEIADGVSKLNIDDNDAESNEMNDNKNETNKPNKSFSYKDMLLKPPVKPVEPVEPVLVIEQIIKEPWKPSFVVKSAPRLRTDRSYGLKKEEIEDDGNGCWDLVDAHTSFKYDTAVTKKRTATLLPFKIQEKKDQRIAEKIGLA